MISEKKETDQDGDSTGGALDIGHQDILAGTTFDF